MARASASDDPLDARLRQREHRERSRERDRRVSAEQRSLRIQRAMHRSSPSTAASSHPSPRTKSDLRLSLRPVNIRDDLARPLEDDEDRQGEEEEEEDDVNGGHYSAPPGTSTLTTSLQSPDSLRAVHGGEREAEEREEEKQTEASSPVYRPLSSAFTAPSASLSSLLSNGGMGGGSVSPSGNAGAGGIASGVEGYDRPLDGPLSRRSSGASFTGPAPTTPELRAAVGLRLQRLSSAAGHLSAAQLQRWMTRLARGDDVDTETETETEGEAELPDGLQRLPAPSRPSPFGDDGHMYDWEGGEQRPRQGSKSKKRPRGPRRRRPPEAAAIDPSQSSSSPSYGRLSAPARSSSLPSAPLPSAAASSSSSASPSRLPSSLMAHRDWNQEFQSLLSQVNDDETVLDNQSAFEQLSELAADFAFTARALGRLIVSEKYLPPAEKTIQPDARIGGIAGGEKFLAHNIVFKFMTDSFGLYGSDESAMVAGNHELLGLSAYYRVIATMRGLGIHVPLACLIDYRGFRLWAVSRLPIDHTATLILGSSNGGARVVNSDPNVSRSMQRIAAVLNLKGHYVTDASGKQTFLFGPFDIEGHRGDDGRAYLLDFHRTFPPEPPHASQHLPHLKKPALVRMLRPELVRNHPAPLSSDAFMRGGAAEEAEVESAYQSLLQQHIPTFAAQLDALGSIDRIDRISALHQQQTERLIRQRALQATPSRLGLQGDGSGADGEEQLADEDPFAAGSFGPSSRAPSPAPSVPPSPPPSPGGHIRLLSDPSVADPIHFSGRFISYLHQAGINIRHLGLLRRAVTTASIRDFLLVEMLARVLKGDMRRRWRAKMATVKHISDSAYRRCSIDFVNLVFFRSPASSQYWRLDVRRQLREKFTRALSDEEEAADFDLKAALLPVPDERDAAPSLFSPVPPQSGSGQAGTAPPAHDPAHLYGLSPAHERRLQKLMRTTSTASTASSAMNGVTTPSPGPRAESPLLPSCAAGPSFASTSSAPAPRLDLLRLVFLRFIHLTGLVLQEGIIGGHLIYNQPSVPLPLQRHDERRRSGTFDSAQAFVDPHAASRPASPSAAPTLPATHSQSLPPRLPHSGLRRTSNSSMHLPTLSNVRSQTTQPLAMPRSTSSTSLQPSHRASGQFSFSTPPGGNGGAEPPLESSSSSFTAPAFFLFYERPMEDLHLSSISEQVKSLNIVSYAEGTALLCKCVSKARREDGSAADDEQNRALTRYLADLAQAKFRESLRRDVDDCLSLCNHSMLTSLVLGDQEQAKALLLSALRANRLHHRSWYYLAQLYAHDLKEPRMADWLYRRALALNPQHVNTHKDLGNLLLFAHKDSAAAEFHYRRAIELQPNHIKALTALGWCLAKKAKQWKDFEAVVDCYRKAAHSNYGDHRTRRTAQQTLMSLLLVKAQLHCDRKEVERARQSLDEAIAYRSPKLLPHQELQSTETGPQFPPAAALAVYAQFERMQGRLQKAEALYLQAIAVQTQLQVDVDANCLVLPSHPQPPLSSATAVRLNGPSSTSTQSLPHRIPASTPLAAPVPLRAGATVAPTAPLASKSVWANGSPAIGVAAPSPTASVASARAKLPQPSSQPALRPPSPTSFIQATASASTSPQLSASGVAVSPSPAASQLTTSLVPPAATSSTPAAAAPKPAVVSVWKQRHQWLPDTTPASQLPLSQLKQRGLGNAAAKVVSNGAAVAAPSPTSRAQPSSTPPTPSLAPSAAAGSDAASSRVLALPSPSNGSTDVTIMTGNGAEATAAPVPDALSLPAVEEPTEEAATSPMPPSEADDDEEESAARDLRSLVSPTPLPSSVPVTPHRRHSSAGQLQAESAERAEEERLEAACVPTSLVRLYADHFHRFRPDDADSAERWYAAAVSLCPFGRTGSLNLASYADFLGRRRHLQFDAQRLFHRAISSPCPAPEALLKYAAYLRDVIQDAQGAQRLTEEAESLKARKVNAGHRCHRTRAGWYCDGYCDVRVVKPMIDAARHWQHPKPHSRPTNHSAQQRPPAQSPAPPPHLSNEPSVIARPPAPNPAPMTVAIPSPAVSPAVSPVASALKGATPAALSPSSMTPAAPLLAHSPRLTPPPPSSAAATAQPRTSWSDVCKHTATPVAQSGAVPSTVPPAVAGGGASAAAQSVASTSPSPSLTAALPVFRPVGATALPVFRGQRTPGTSTAAAVGSAASAAAQKRPAAASSPSPPLPLPMPFPAPSPPRHSHSRKG